MTNIWKMVFFLAIQIFQKATHCSRTQTFKIPFQNHISLFQNDHYVQHVVHPPSTTFFAASSLLYMPLHIEYNVYHLYTAHAFINLIHKESKSSKHNWVHHLFQTLRGTVNAYQTIVFWVKVTMCELYCSYLYIIKLLRVNIHNFTSDAGTTSSAISVSNVFYLEFE